MYDYTVYCTPEQTKKALELGAPIDKDMYAPIIRYEQPWYCIDKEKSFAYHIPTAEQMIGWLEEKDEIQEFDIAIWEDPLWSSIVHLKNKPAIILKKTYRTRKEATIAAIDAALEYLMSLHHDFLNG